MPQAWIEQATPPFAPFRKGRPKTGYPFHKKSSAVCSTTELLRQISKIQNKFCSMNAKFSKINLIDLVFNPNAFSDFLNSGKD